MKKYLALLIIISVSFLLLQSCKDKGTEPQPEPKPPGYQEDIPWPSLADSPWPMSHGNPQLNGRSKYQFQIFSRVEKEIEDYQTSSGIVTGSDSNFYFISTCGKPGLVSLTDNGDSNWIYSLPEICGSGSFSTPIVTQKNAVIFSHRLTDTLYSISRNGTLNWKMHIETRNEIGINKDGSIFVIGTNPAGLNVISEDGELLWQFLNSDFFPHSITFSSDGKYIFILGVEINSYYCIDIINQKIQWAKKINGENFYISPVCDSDGRVYLFLRDENQFTTLNCFTTDGELIWSYKLEKENEHSVKPSIDNKGNIYFGGNNRLYSVDYNGILRWKIHMESINTEIIIDKNSKLIFPRHSNSGIIEELMMLGPNGETVHSIVLPEYYPGPLDYAPAYNENGSMLLNYYKQNKLFLIK